ncbi:MAG: threonylcarbamoyl-AMP synthase [Bacteroidales bacterium]|nr:threonylcarbamoyl-AMP synthase [Bacteroidales bacterium]
MNQLSNYKDDLIKSLETLKKDGTILYPTDTIWGIGCDATNAKAVDKIYSIKNRVESKSMIILLADYEQLKYYIKTVPSIAADLIQSIDKPLTIIYNGAKNLASNLIAKDGTIAIRIIKHDFCRTLIQTLEHPLVSTSANLSGAQSPHFFAHIQDHIKTKVDYIVNLEQDIKTVNMASTIIKLENSGKYTIIRE